LNPDGRLYVVTITGLRRFIEKGFKEVFGNYEKLKQGRDYTVALARRERG
jgi:16S rRNA (guanine1207-N2)-methyltransferase